MKIGLPLKWDATVGFAKWGIVIFLDLEWGEKPLVQDLWFFWPMAAKKKKKIFLDLVK